MMLLRLLNRKPRLKAKANDAEPKGLCHCGRTGDHGFDRHPDRKGGSMKTWLLFFLTWICQAVALLASLADDLTMQVVPVTESQWNQLYLIGKADRNGVR